ncbi:hypothetical protein EV360DRAFT_74555 [Lentinula raphanica]|nr:hypothetical protein EV360DRAFT_74555 [Lentinula raphanica]
MAWTHGGPSSPYHQALFKNDFFFLNYKTASQATVTYKLLTLLLWMIAAAIGSPINHKPPSSKNPKPLGAVRRPSSNAYALPAMPGRVPSAIDSAHAKPQQRTMSVVKDYIIVLTIHLGQVYRADGLGLLDPKALHLRKWAIALRTWHVLVRNVTVQMYSIDSICVLSKM